MEVIELQGYTEFEKLNIAFNYLIKRQTEENGLQPADLQFTEAAVRHIAHRYTREAGVRNLERLIGTVCRKRARKIAEARSASTNGADGKEAVVEGEAKQAPPVEPLEVTPAVVEEYLGAPKIREDAEIAERTRKPGVAVGLAWTPAGGDILFIEATKMSGSGKGMILTGHLGQVMQESMQAALSWVRANAAALGIRPGFFKDYDLHMHVPAGAIPKDGPSAGVTVTTALVSLLTGRRVRPNWAMTGETTLSGLVLPVGGIKEKVLAARRVGVTDIILPKENKVQVEEDLKSEQLGDLRMHYVDTIEEVVALALVKHGEDVDEAVEEKAAEPAAAVHP
jgi:ATP-dependent Lon protease